MSDQPIDEVNQIVTELINNWCERRALKALRCVLVAWPHTGLTDSVGNLTIALKDARALARDELDKTELDRLSRAIALLDQMVNTSS